MKFTLTLRDELATAVLDRPDPEEFVERAVSAAVAAEENPHRAIPEPLSRWAALAQKIQAEARPLGDYYKTLRRDQQEFRSGFSFRHDPPE